ncbi:uncharacterized protein BX664DRAFT_281299 [Halteromyces radiatus]|uniref:uncharacterized protein n=1 Tax=Halteromyces radiatus TaxID=101107 RepID=UPI00221EC2F3|nr:uncharacterized protein BX664DRAFT_281299 [Halteromyces radiatus]KAI8089955.1 hypothetical protein BX664DRAFT_281299 [Halteromyces radiatus]
MSDPIAPHSAPIAAYMSVHQATNLAYVRYFGKIDNATSATFQSLDSQGFHVSYTLPDNSSSQVYIKFKTPLTKREDIRPVLEDMAKEAETALGLPSSLVGPPPVAAIAKALYAQTTDIYTPPTPSVPLDAFYPVSVSEALRFGVFLGFFALFGYASDTQLPRLLQPIRQSIISPIISKKIFKAVVYIHLAEASLAFFMCLRRGWYGPSNILKWTASTFFFGFNSMRLLRKHAKDVQGI